MLCLHSAFKTHLKVMVMVRIWLYNFSAAVLRVGCYNRRYCSNGCCESGLYRQLFIFALFRRFCLFHNSSEEVHQTCCVCHAELYALPAQKQAMHTAMCAAPLHTAHGNLMPIGSVTLPWAAWKPCNFVSLRAIVLKSVSVVCESQNSFPSLHWWTNLSAKGLPIWAVCQALASSWQHVWRWHWSLWVQVALVLNAAACCDSCLIAGPVTVGSAKAVCAAVVVWD